MKKILLSICLSLACLTTQAGMSPASNVISANTKPAATNTVFSPSAPIIISAVGTTPSNVVVQLQYVPVSTNAGAAVGFTLYRSPSGCSAFVPIVTQTNGTTAVISYTDSNLTPSTTYCYQAVSFN